MGARTFTPADAARGHRRKRADNANGKARRDRRITRGDAVILAIILAAWIADPDAPLAQLEIARRAAVRIHRDGAGAPIVPAQVTRSVSRLVAYGYVDRDGVPGSYELARTTGHWRERCNRYAPTANPGVARPVTWSPVPRPIDDRGVICVSSPTSSRGIGAPVTATRTPTIDPCAACGRPPGPCPLADPTHCGREAPP